MFLQELYEKLPIGALQTQRTSTRNTSSDDIKLPLGDVLLYLRWHVLDLKM